MSIPAESSPPSEESGILTRVRSSSIPPSRTAVDGLTDDLLVETLSRVPAKTLCRSRRVSNHWLSLIDHPDHRKKLPQTPAGFFHGSSTTTDEWLLESPISRGDAALRSTPLAPSCSTTGVSIYWTAATASSSAAGTTSPPGVCNPVTEKWIILRGDLHYANFWRYGDGASIRLVVYVLKNYKNRE